MGWLTSHEPSRNSIFDFGKSSLSTFDTSLRQNNGQWHHRTLAAKRLHPAKATGHVFFHGNRSGTHLSNATPPRNSRHDFSGLRGESTVNKIQ